MGVFRLFDEKAGNWDGWRKGWFEWRLWEGLRGLRGLKGGRGLKCLKGGRGLKGGEVERFAFYLRAFSPEWGVQQQPRV